MLTEKYYGNFYMPIASSDPVDPSEPDPKVLRITKAPRTVLNQLCRVSKALKSSSNKNSNDHQDAFPPELNNDGEERH